MDFSTPTIDLIHSGLKNAQTVNADQVLYNRIKESGDSKEQLKKVDGNWIKLDEKEWWVIDYENIRGDFV